VRTGVFSNKKGALIIVRKLLHKWVGCAIVEITNEVRPESILPIFNLP
jgi:hypothetical protein